MMIVRLSAVRFAFLPPLDVVSKYGHRIGCGSQTSSRRTFSSEVQNPANRITSTSDDIAKAHSHTSSGSGGIGLHNVRDRT
jgi:hypothetical protein